jgi:hypothetical protein
MNKTFEIIETQPSIVVVALIVSILCFIWYITDVIRGKE